MSGGIASEPDVLRTGVLIIGAGAAGLRAAIELAGEGIECLVIGKRGHGDAHTRWAAGGINASLGSLDPGDRWDLHAADTVREAHFICDPHAVELLAGEAPGRVHELAAWGCPFDRTEDGRINQRYFGAQSFRRTCFVGDETGEAILRTLVQRAEEVGVAWMDEVYVTSLLVGDGAVRGALAVEMESGAPLVFAAAATVLAAGGHTSIYRRGSSRPDENTGDGPALAYDAGATLRDMEFVQFHPTGWVHPAGMRGRLVTEAVRGEGGRLFNADGERFMERYAPERMELEARDVVARAIYREIRGGRATGHDGVLLDITHRDPAYIHERLPHVQRDFLAHGVDITREPMEVAPTAHYAMGGVVVDFATGATDVPGLFAAGETTGGLHGANRLGGNSLAETVVFGHRVGVHLAKLGARVPDEAPPDAGWRARQRLGKLFASGGTAPGDLIDEVRGTMWECAGIVRDRGALEDGVRRLDRVARALPTVAVGPDASQSELVAALDLQWMCIAGEAVLRCALLREESRGAHFREDHPGEREEWRRTILCRRGEEGAMEVRTMAILPLSDAVRKAVDEHRVLDYHHLE